ncbi:MAG: hypothetical protein R3E83_21440 [Burkholderiaceae bacterium]
MVPIPGPRSSCHARASHRATGIHLALLVIACLGCIGPGDARSAADEDRFELGEIRTDHGWRYRITVSLADHDSGAPVMPDARSGSLSGALHAGAPGRLNPAAVHPDDRRAGAAPVSRARVGLWDVDLRPHHGHLLMEQRRRPYGGANDTWPRLLRTIAQPIPDAARPRLPDWLALGSVARVFAHSDGRRRLLTGIGHLTAPPQASRQQFIAAAMAQGVRLIPLPLPDAQSAADADWGLWGQAGSAEFMLTGHRAHGGTAWVLHWAQGGAAP